MRLEEKAHEKRNLDVNCMEILFESGDHTEDYDRILDKLDGYNYLLARVPAGNMEVAYEMQKRGFTFAETNFHLSANLNDLKLPYEFERYEQDITCAEANQEDLLHIYKAIRSGVFDSDKVALDPQFGIALSARRFENWTKQELENAQAKAYIVRYLNKDIGFYILREESDSIGDAMLSALYDRKKHVGLGYAVAYHQMLTAKCDGKKRIITGISSNNPSSLRLHLSLGYEIKNINYTFIRHL